MNSIWPSHKANVSFESTLLVTVWRLLYPVDSAFHTASLGRNCMPCSSSSWYFLSRQSLSVQQGLRGQCWATVAHGTINSDVSYVHMHSSPSCWRGEDISLPACSGLHVTDMPPGEKEPCSREETLVFGHEASSTKEALLRTAVGHEDLHSGVHLVTWGRRLPTQSVIIQCLPLSTRCFSARHVILLSYKCAELVLWLYFTTLKKAHLPDLEPFF